MGDFDADSLAQHAVMLGLLTREQAREALAEARDGSLDALTGALLRKGYMTSWQIERLKRGDPSGFFFGGCKVLFHLAEGTFARVYRGQNGMTDLPVAIKVLRNRFTADPESVRRFDKEAEAGMALRHPNIVQIVDFGEVDKSHYMIMEYVEGSNLRELLRIRTRFSAKEALPLMIGLVRGLGYALEQGVTHRDIKGTNILISTTGEAKLVDFGLATIQGDTKKAAMSSQRTVDYSALERTCGSEKGDPRSDIYFLGCVFYQMLTGVVPMPETESKDPLEKMLKRSFGAIKPLSEHKFAPDSELTGIVEKMMKVDLRLRYQNINDVLQDLERYEAHLKAPGTETVVDDEFDSKQIFLNRLFEDELPPATSPPEAAPTPIEEPAAAEAQDPAEDEPAVPVVTRPSPAMKCVLCVEAQAEVQDAFRKSFSAMGYRVIIVGDPERAAERYRESPPDAVVFDADGLGPEAVDAFLDMHDKAHEDGHELAALVLLGTKQHALQEKLPNDDRLVVFAKPIKMKHLQAALSDLVPVGARADRVGNG